MPFNAITTVPHGIEARRVDVEADVSPGLPDFRIVGLPDAAVRESKDRIKHAIRNSGVKFPDTKVMINLAPASLRKTGGLADLAIAVAILRAGKLVPETKENILFLGELALDGALRGGPGILASAFVADKEGADAIVVPASCAAEASLVPGLRVLSAETLEEVIKHLKGDEGLHVATLPEISSEPKPDGAEALRLVRGQESAKRALEIAAAGGHNLLMIGPPGSGKTLLAKALAELLPPLAWEESLEVTRINSVTGEIDPDTPLVRRRPFRSPHHTSTAAALVGGGSTPVPGEVTRAHRGVLFLDELPEFPRNVLETLRQPLEDGAITIARATDRWTFPSRCMLVAAMNPCPCGYGGEPDATCVCTPARKERYASVLSGPLVDRIDLVVRVPRMKSREYLDERSEKGVNEWNPAKRISKARALQSKRAKKTGVGSNAELSEKHRKSVLSVGTEERSFLEQAAEAMKLSARGISRVLKVSRTIADLEGAKEIKKPHLSEALQFRQ